MQHSLSTLNLNQQLAVKHIDTPLLVIAGAGSGKTRVITHKIAYLISQCGYLAKHITAITFTNKAAKEMLLRATHLLKDVDTRGLTITTFHSLGLKILKEESQLLGYKKTFSILDSHDSAKIISDIVKTTDRGFIKLLQTKFSMWKNSFATVEQLLNQATDGIDIENANIFRQYQDTLKAYQAMDFDDLIRLPVDLFKQNPEALYKWQQRIRYLLIDEYQDTNLCQYQLIKLITQRYQGFTAVGDDDQSIYEWRGADIANLTNLQNDFPKLHVIKLEQNYRSTVTILTAANNIIAHNPKLFSKRLWSEFGQGEAIRIIACKNEEAEADMVARKIMLHQLQYQSNFSNYAILYRSNHQSRILEQTLRNYQLPYTISGGQSFFDKTEIKDIIAYLRLLVNDDDDTAFIRAVTTPKRGIGETTIAKLATYATTRHISLFAALFEEGFATTCNATQLNDLITFGKFINDIQFRMQREPVESIVTDLIDIIKYEEYLYEQDNSKIAEKRMANVLNLVGWLSKKATEQNRSLPDLVQMITLINLLDSGESTDVSAIKLSTLHAAKGLEYPYVFLINCEDGILPHQESINIDKLDEERRLMYVGITRAQKELTISYSEERRKEGELQTRQRSRFIAEMGEENIIDTLKNKSQKIQDNQELQDRLQLLRDLLKN